MSSPEKYERLARPAGESARLERRELAGGIRTAERLDLHMTLAGPKHAAIAEDLGDEICPNI